MVVSGSVVKSLFIDAPVVRGGFVFDPHFCVQFSASFLVLQTS